MGKQVMCMKENPIYIVRNYKSTEKISLKPKNWKVATKDFLEEPKVVFAT